MVPLGKGGGWFASTWAEARHGPEAWCAGTFARMAASASWTSDELRRELERFETELREAGLAANSVRTYVDRSLVFVRWLSGDYVPGQR